MADYITIKGYTLQNRTSDPLATGVAGAAWASGGNLPVALYENAGAGTTHSAALNFGGQGNDPSPAHPHSADTQTYNGTSWTEVNNLNNSRRSLSGAGTQTSALAFGGYTTPPGSDGTQVHTESWNGTSWTEKNNLSTKRKDAQGIGVSNTACICAGGNNGSGSVNNNESWNGTSWTEVAEINTTRERFAATGSSTAGIIATGYASSPDAVTANVELWNGSAWTETGNVNTARSFVGGSGTNSDMIIAGGAPNVANTEFWDGSTWTEVADLANGRYLTGSAGDTAVQAIVFGGEGRSNSTEEFSAAGIADSLIDTGQVFYRSDTGDMKVTLNVLGTGAWASGGNTNHQDTERGGSAGTQTAGLIFGGGTPPAPIQATTEQYNGSTWTEVSALNTGRQALKGSVNSPYTSAIGFGGASSTTNPSGSNLNESWNGSSWTEIAELNTAAKNAGGCGTTTDALKISGQTAPGSALATVEKWNGNSWTEIAEVNSNRLEIMATGGSTSAIATGGSFIDGSPPNAALNNVEIWNGTSWTESTEINTARKNQHGCAGSSGSDALVYGGDIQPGVTANTELWNGSSWTELNNMATARSGIGGAGSSSTAFAARGTTPSATNATEEWTVPATVTNTTITD